MKRALMIAVAAAAAAIAVPAAVSMAGDTLTVVSWGGAYQKSQQEAFFKPYIAAGNQLIEEEWTGDIAKIRAMVESNSVTWDVIDFDTGLIMAACAEGLLEKFDWAKLGLDRSKFIGGDLVECGVPNIVYATVYAYDTTKLATGPTTVNDFFDLAKFPGKRGIYKSPVVNLEWALIADGVPTADVYTVLRTPEGVDRAFAKLEGLKKDAVWWEAGAQAPQLLADGQVVMTQAWNGRIQNAVKNDKKPFKIVWDNQGFDWDWWGVPKGGPRVEAAMKFIAFASQPAVMAEQTKHIAYGPANKDAVPNIDPSVLGDLPTAPGNMGNVLYVDPTFWAENRESLTERFNAWLAK